MRAEDDARVCELVIRLIPIVKKRVMQATERSREDVEFELATLASLLTIQSEIRCADF
jgi:hypothetical protein